MPFETTSTKMNIFSIRTWPSLLLVFAIVFYKAECWCSNQENSQPLRFQHIQNNNRNYTFFLPEGFQLEISCCVVSKSPSVNWLFNGKPINEYGDLFALSEKGQVLQSANEALRNNSVLAGVYNCTFIEGNESLSAAYIVPRFSPIDAICLQGKTTDVLYCLQGKTTDVLVNHPPSSRYHVASQSSLTLECTLLLLCHTVLAVDEVYWEKYYWKFSADTTVVDEDSDNWVTIYTILRNSRYNPFKRIGGNYVNVTSRNIGNNQMLVTTVLHIANITDEDLHDPYNPNGYSYLSCENSKEDCFTNRTKNYYRCGYNGAITTNPLQNVLRRYRSLALFSGAPPTSPPQITVQPETSRLEQDGVIIGSTIGAAFILITIFALVFVAYEWHLKLYIRRVLLQLRRKSGSKTANYKYSCYVACCIKDDKFVYEVLRQQMEEQHGYRLCLPERDFSVGTAIPDEIERCIRSSEYFMAVISPGFWETEWCSLSVDLALRTNAKVVAVIAKELGKDQRDQGNRLMTALKSPGCTSIESSLLTRESSWEKLVLRLRYAMPQLD